MSLQLVKQTDFGDFLSSRTFEEYLLAICSIFYRWCSKSSYLIKEKFSYCTVCTGTAFLIDSLTNFPASVDPEVSYLGEKNCLWKKEVNHPMRLFLKGTVAWKVFWPFRPSVI